jgi:hypothetical protein
MLTTLIGPILIVIVLIWRDLDGRIKDHAASARTASEANKSLAQIAGTLDSMHETILKLWACPICLGTGNVPEWCDSSIAGKPCGSCKGTGMRKIRRETEKSSVWKSWRP